MQGPRAMLSRRWREGRYEHKCGAHENESRASSSISAATALQLQVDTQVPQKKRLGASQCEAGRRLHAARSLSARSRQHGTEIRHFDDRDAGCGEYRH